MSRRIFRRVIRSASGIRPGTNPRVHYTRHTLECGHTVTLEHAISDGSAMQHNPVRCRECEARSPT